MPSSNSKHYRKFIEEWGPYNKAKFEEFIQVECGYKHALLLNKRGQVFSLGSGCQGQLGIGEDEKPL